MRSGQGKSKGSAFEREICKKLSLWISEGRRTSVFWRSPMSGGRVTVQLSTITSQDELKDKLMKNQIGDISSMDRPGDKFIDRYVVECKFYKNLKLDALIYGQPKDGVLAFWGKLVSQSNITNKLPILIMKQNHKPILIGIAGDDKLFKHIQQECYLDALAYYPKHNLVLYDFNSLLEEVDPAIFEVL